MGEETAPVTLEALMAALTQTNQAIHALDTRVGTMHTDIGTFRTRLDRLDPPNLNVAPIGPIRNVPPAAHRANYEPRREEEPPDDFMRRNYADRNRPREDERILPPEVKLTAPTFAGKIDPAAYLEWEKRLEHLFEYYAYTEPKKIALAIASLTDHALAWWDREAAEKRRLRYPQITRWADMKLELRRRYVPPHYHRELLKRFRALFQGTRSVEEYFEEFELIRSHLELEETEESLMSQFVDGLQDRIQRKVEIQPYHSLQEVLYLAIQREQQIKKKTSTRSRPKENSWSQPQSTPPPPPVVEKGKSIAIDSRFKSNDYQAEQGKSFNSQRSHDIVCYKCQGRGHMARDCPNKRVMIITADGYDSQDESEMTQLEETTVYPDVGELLVIQRALSVQPTTNEPEQRDNLFHTRCTISDKVCHLIVDSGSCTNIASVTLVEKLGLHTTNHPRPYKLRWLNDKEEISVSKQVEVPFSIGQYQDQVLCDVAPMQAGHILLGRPWQYDRDVVHNGRTNLYTLCHNNHKFVLAPLDQKEGRVMQARTRVSATSRVSFHIDKVSYLCQNTDMIPLSLPKESFSGFGETKRQDAIPDAAPLIRNHIPTLELHAAKGLCHAMLTQAVSHETSNKPEPKKHQGKVLNSQKRMSINLLSLGVGLQVSRSKLSQGGGYDVGIKSATTGINGHDGLAKDKGETNFLGEHIMDKGEPIFHGLFFLDLNPPTYSLTDQTRSEHFQYCTEEPEALPENAEKEGLPDKAETREERPDNAEDRSELLTNSHFTRAFSPGLKKHSTSLYKEGFHPGKQRLVQLRIGAGLRIPQSDGVAPFKESDPPDQCDAFLLFFPDLTKTSCCLETSKTAAHPETRLETTREKVSFSDQAISFSPPSTSSLFNLDPPSIPRHPRRPKPQRDLEESFIHAAKLKGALPLMPNG